MHPTFLVFAYDAILIFPQFVNLFVIYWLLCFYIIIYNGFLCFLYQGRVYFYEHLFSRIFNLLKLKKNLPDDWPVVFVPLILSAYLNWRHYNCHLSQTRHKLCACISSRCLPQKKESRQKVNSNRHTFIKRLSRL